MTALDVLVAVLAAVGCVLLEPVIGWLPALVVLGLLAAGWGFLTPSS